MANIPAKIQQIIDEGYSFNFGDYISRGFNLTQYDLGSFAGYTFVQFLIQMVAGVVPFVGALAGIVIAPPLNMGYAIVSNKIDKNEAYQFSDFFRGFDKLGNLMLTALISALIIVGAAIPGLAVLFGSMYSSGFFDDPSAANLPLLFLGVFVMIIPAIYLGVSYMWAPHFVWFYDLQPWDAMETSRKLVGSNWWTFFGFAIVAGFIGSAGLLLCGIGLLFTLPAMTCAQYACFADITRLLEGESSEEDVISHFVPGE